MTYVIGEFNFVKWKRCKVLLKDLSVLNLLHALKFNFFK